jgi:hypothetical protein
MTHRFVRYPLMSLAALIATIAVGCARWIEVKPSVEVQQESVAEAISSDERVPLVVHGFRVIQNGAPLNPPIEIERRILSTMQETRLFSSLVPLGSDSSSLGEKVIAARITFDETIDPHAGGAAWKGFVIGASMFLLSPAIELDYDYGARAALELERWDGQVKRYEARSAGTVHYNLFGATPIMIDELKGQVTETCLSQLMDQLVRDTVFYTASSTPLPDPSVRTVTVKARSPALPSAAHTIVPVGTSSAP